MEQGFTHQLHEFPSGLRLVTVPMPSAKTATVFVLVSCGSKYEARELLGVSHFLEHMMFRGTEQRPDKSKIAGVLDGIGASYNAFTGKEVTGYYVKAAATKLDIIMDVVFDIFLNSKLAPDAMEIERGPILEELKMRRDDPQQHIGELLEQLLYGDQPAGWEIGGTPETIANMKAADLRQWFDKHYVAKNTVIAVAGGIDPEQVKAKVELVFAGIRQASKSEKPATVEAQTKPAIVTFPKDVEQMYVQLAVRTFDMYDDRRYALALLTQILGGDMSSRLWDEIREKRGLAYYIYAGNSLSTDSGFFQVSAGLNQAKASEGIKVILAELAKVVAEGVTEEELQRTKDQAEGRMAFMLESTNGTADDYGGSLLFHGRILSPDDELAKMKAVTREQIQAVAKDIFHDDRLNLAVIGPAVTADAFREALTFSAT